MTKHFEHLFVFGRPAGGKSEFIDYMKKCDPAKRLANFYISPFDIFDDYLFLTEIATHEDALEALNVPRFMTTRTKDGIAVINDIFWPYAIQRLNVMIKNDHELTLLTEFSRGAGEWGYKSALTGLKPEILSRCGVIYIKVSYEEALRRNESRYQEKLKHSVLAHKCPEHIMEKYYKYDDWLDITQNMPSGKLEINGVNVPFVTMENEPESKDDAVLETRYGNALKTLWDLYEKNVR
jgi:hypothetical protein